MFKHLLCLFFFLSIKLLEDKIILNPNPHGVSCKIRVPLVYFSFVIGFSFFRGFRGSGCYIYIYVLYHLDYIRRCLLYHFVCIFVCPYLTHASKMKSKATTGCRRAPLWTLLSVRVASWRTAAARDAAHADQRAAYRRQFLAVLSTDHAAAGHLAEAIARQYHCLMPTPVAASSIRRC